MPLMSIKLPRTLGLVIMNNDVLNNLVYAPLCTFYVTASHVYYPLDGSVGLSFLKKRSNLKMISEK